MQDQFTTFFVDLLNIIKNPGSQSITTFVGDLSLFWLVPFSAGYLRLEAHN